MPPRHCLLFLSAFSAYSAVAAASVVVDLTPLHDAARVLVNPDKGWYHHYPDNHPDKYAIATDADLLEFPGMDHLYIRLAWSYLEPKEGRFHWAAIDPLIDKWTAHGLGIAFRISCKETSTDRVEQQYATPRWVMEAGAKGGYYRMGQPTGPEGPWEPVFDDPVYLEKLDRFLAAFAARYDSQPWLRCVDVGSIGDWGEGHSWAGSRTEVGFAARKRHIDLHLRHFRRAQLVVSDDFVYALSDPAERQALHQYVLDHGISYRDDSILVNGYVQGVSDTFTVRSPQFFADAYLHTPTVFELEHYSAVKRLGNWEGRPDSLVAKFGQGKLGPDYFRGALGLLHATYIGYHGDARDWLNDNPELTRELVNRCGYWLFPTAIELPQALQAGVTNAVRLTVENRGVAPPYEPYELRAKLTGSDRTTVSVLATGVRSWMPGPPQASNYELVLPADLPAGRYALALGLFKVGPGPERPVEWALSATARDPEGFYRLTEVIVGGSPTPPAAASAGPEPAVMHFPGAEWTVVPPEAEGMDPARLESAVEFLRLRTGRDGVGEMVIVRRGRVVWQGDRATNVHGVWSVTKSFTSTCLGLLMDDGCCAPETRAATLVPALDAHYAQVTLRHLTTMTSGYRAVGDESRPDGYGHGPSATPFEPSPEPLFSPGAAYAYWDSAMNVFALALTRAAGEPLDELFRRRIADPIAMDPAGWRWGDFGKVDGLRVNGGSGNHNRHVLIHALNLARLGHLFLNHGRWSGRQLISSNWVQAATTVQVPASLPNAWPPSGIRGPGEYGFNWWIKRGSADGGSRAGPAGFAAQGFNNNLLVVLPDWDLVVVRLGLDQTDGRLAGDIFDEFLRRLEQACVGPQRVVVRETEYEGRPQFLVATPSATWFLDRNAGGFSRLLDRDGQDWISFRKEPLSKFPGSAGAGYRGLPNAVYGRDNPDAGAGHPGFDACESSVAAPNVIRTVSRSGRFAWTWTFSGSTARFHLEKADSEYPWWFLYEGTVGGRWSPSTHYWGTDLGGPRREQPDIQQQLFEQWRWAYFGDEASPQVLFVAQDQPDTLPDTLWYLGAENGGAITSTTGMIVFGLGRGRGTAPQFRGAGETFVVGLIRQVVRDSNDHLAVAAAIQAALTDR